MVSAERDPVPKEGFCRISRRCLTYTPAGFLCQYFAPYDFAPCERWRHLLENDKALTRGIENLRVGFHGPSHDGI
jgi:hypothetical protein